MPYSIYGVCRNVDSFFLNTGYEYFAIVNEVE